MAKITLDAETFRALASSTRLTVLKSLDERRKTLTELSRDLALNKATVHEHMALLAAAGLVRKRDDEGRKWIYYELTWTGQRILHPEATTTFNLLLGLSVAAAGGGIGMLGHALGWWFASHHAALAQEGVGYGNTQDLGGNKTAPAPAAAGSTGTTTGSSSATSTSGGPAAASAQSSAAPSGTGAHNALGIGAPAQDSAAHHSYFFDDGGWVALALIATCVLFILLALALRNRLKPKPGNEASAAAAEATRNRLP